MNRLVLYFTDALHSLVWAINSKCASLYGQIYVIYALINRFDGYPKGYGYNIKFYPLHFAGTGIP
jgi:hypothetical protein